MVSGEVQASLMRALMLSALTGAVLSPAPAWAARCRDEVGTARAAALVAQCVEVSPATRPPCNASNACDLIISEIVRGCRLLDDGSAPSFCRHDGD